MTGMDVLRRCARYDSDVERLRAMLLCTRDAMTRITRPTDAQGHGGQMDKMAQMAARVDELERALAARAKAHDMEVMEALRLSGQIDHAEAAAVMYQHYVMGDTYAAIAVGRRTSEAAVRSFARRGRQLFTSVTSKLGESEAYHRLREEEGAAR